MDKRIKYSLREKLSLVRAIIAGRHSCGSAARQLGSNLTTVRRWVNLYKQHGAAGLKRRSEPYSGQFKVRVISYMLKNHLSLMQTAAFFGIPGDHTIALWLKKYEGLGAAGLLKETRGRKRTTMAKGSKKKNKQLSSASTDKKLAALQRENEYLRAENAFLKKLDALIQEEQTQDSRQKPSRN